MTTTATSSSTFTTLAELQENHSALVKEVGKDILSPANLRRIDKFLRKSIKTGAVLDVHSDRVSAQSLVSFWITRLAAALRDSGNKKPQVKVPEFEDTLLAEFNSDDLTSTVIVPTDKWLDRQSSEDQILARRLMLRLVRLREDGSFDLLPSAAGVTEDLAPQDRALFVLAELVRLGVVRSTRDLAGNEDYAIRTEELLTRWPRFQQWLAERRGFRQKANDWAQRRADKAADPSNQSLMRRAERHFGLAVSKIGLWMEARWLAILALIHVRSVTEDFLAEDEYEEAQTYRDKNAVELRLVYQKRQQDRERQERRRARLVIFAAAAFLFATVSGVAIWGWVEADIAKYKEKAAKDRETAAKNEEKRAKEEAENGRKNANLQNASWQHERGTQLLDERDASGSFLWSATAWLGFDASATVLQDEIERTRRGTGYLLRLGIARQQLPHILGIAYHKDSGEAGGASARTPDSDLLLTVGVNEVAELQIPGVCLWRRTKQSESTGWQKVTLDWGTHPPGQSFAKAAAYLSSDGRFAVVSGTPKEATSSSVYVWQIQNPGKERLLRQLTDVRGQTTDAAFSPDNQFFAMASDLGDKKGKITVWPCDRWEGTLDLPNSEVDGAFGPPVFSPSGQDCQLTLAVGHAPSLNEPSICLEWALQTSLEEKQARQYTISSAFAANFPSSINDAPPLVKYRPDGGALLVAHKLQSRPVIWMFETKKALAHSAASLLVQSLGANLNPSLTHALIAAKVLEAKGASRLISGANLLPELIWLPPEHTVSDVSFSPLNDRFVTAGNDGTAIVWSQSTDSNLRYANSFIRLRHSAQVFKAVFSADGQYIITASRDKSARVWQVNSGQQIHFAQQVHSSIYHSGSVTDAGFIEHGRRIITSSRDITYLWDLTGEETQSMPLGTSRKDRTTFADWVGPRVVTAGERQAQSASDRSTGWVHVWDVETPGYPCREIPHTSKVVHAAIGGPDSGFVTTVTDDGTIRLWDLNNCHMVWSEQPKEGKALCSMFGFSEGATRLAVLIRDEDRHSHIKVYSLNSKGKQAVSFDQTRFDDAFNAAILSPECKWVVAYGIGPNGQGIAGVWNLQSQSSISGLLKGNGKFGSAHDEPITHVAFSNDGEQLVTTGKDDKAVVWNLKNRQPYELKAPKEAVGHTGDVMFASFNSKGTRVVTAGSDGRAIVWERTPQNPEYHLYKKLENGRAVGRANFIADDAYVITADEDGTARVWDAEDGRPIGTKYQAGPILQCEGQKSEKGGQRMRILVDLARSARANLGRSSITTIPVNSGLTSAEICPAVAEWQLRPSAPFEEADLDVVHLIASRKLSFDNYLPRLALLAQDTIYDLWKDAIANQKLTNYRHQDVDPCKWHEREATLCELYGRWDQALEHWSHALEYVIDKELRSALLAHRADAHAELLHWNSAENDLTDALELPLPQMKQWMKAQLWRARANVRLHQTPQKIEEAVFDFLEAAKASPEDGFLRSQLAGALALAKQFPQALKEYDEALESDPNNPDLILKRANVLAKLADRPYPQEYEAFLKAGQLFKARATLEQSTGAYANANIDLDHAVGAYHGAIRLFSHQVEPSPKTQARVYADLGEVQMSRAILRPLPPLDEQQSRYRDASKQFSLALKLNPNDLAIYHSLANSLIQSREWDEAAKVCEEIVRREPDLAINRIRLAAIYLQQISPNGSLRTAGLEAACRLLENALKVEKIEQDPQVWTHLAQTQLAAGKIEEYKSTRNHMFEKFSTSGAIAPTNNSVAWTAVLSSDTSEGAKRSIPFADRAVSAFPSTASYLNTYGAVLYRNGRREEAILKLESATRERLRTNLSQELRAYGDAHDLLFKAMAQFTSANEKQALEGFRQAVRLVESVKPLQKTEPPDTSIIRVWDRIEFDFLQKEAESLINHSSKTTIPN